MSDLRGDRDEDQARESRHCPDRVREHLRRPRGHGDRQRGRGGRARANQSATSASSMRASPARCSGTRALVPVRRTVPTRRSASGEEAGALDLPPQPHGIRAVLTDRQARPAELPFLIRRLPDCRARRSPPGLAAKAHPAGWSRRDAGATCCRPGVQVRPGTREGAAAAFRARRRTSDQLRPGIRPVTWVQAPPGGIRERSPARPPTQEPGGFRRTRERQAGPTKPAVRSPGTCRGRPGVDGEWWVLPTRSRPSCRCLHTVRGPNAALRPPMRVRTMSAGPCSVPGAGGVRRRRA